MVVDVVEDVPVDLVAEDPGELPAAENPVWRFFQSALARIAPVNTMLEPTNSLPPLSQLLEDLRDIQDLAAAA